MYINVHPCMHAVKFERKRKERKKEKKVAASMYML